MVEETELQKLNRDYPDFFKKTSPKVIDFALSEETASKIADICVKNGVEDGEKIEEIAQRIIWVILSKLPKENLALTFEQGVRLTPETAKKISDEVNQLIFSAAPQLKSEKTIPPKKELPEEKPKRPPGKDTYREPVE